MKINITAGEALNNLLSEKYTGVFIPFNEAMIKGGYTYPLFSKEFQIERAGIHNISVEEYTEKLKPFLNFLKNIKDYSSVTLWFGDEPFCQRNLEVVLLALKEYDYRGKICINIVNEYTCEIKNVQIV